MRRYYKIAILNDKVMNGYGWQVQLEGLPLSAIVERNLDAGFCAREQQATLSRVFADHAGKDILSKASGDPCPGLPIVVRLIKVGLEVVQFIARGCHIGRGRIVRRWFDDADQGPFWKIRRCDILPVLATVA